MAYIQVDLTKLKDSGTRVVGQMDQFLCKLENLSANTERLRASWQGPDAKVFCDLFVNAEEGAVVAGRQLKDAVVERAKHLKESAEKYADTQQDVVKEAYKI